MAVNEAWRGAVKAAILEYLSKHPGGRSAREVAAAINRARDGVSTRLAELQDTGRVIGILVHHNKGRDYKLWFAVEFEAQARLAGDPGFVRARTVAKALAPKPTRRHDGGGPVFIEAPKFVDMRFTPERVEPFFSAMTPGSYLRTGSAIERAYAERDARAHVSEPAHAAG